MLVYLSAGDSAGFECPANANACVQVSTQLHTASQQLSTLNTATHILTHASTHADEHTNASQTGIVKKKMVEKKIEWTRQKNSREPVD
jgi:hypothetical protein